MIVAMLATNTLPHSWTACAQFAPLLPVGLGFAAGAMLWVAVTELLMDAIKETGSTPTVAATACTAMGAMAAAQRAIESQV